MADSPKHLECTKGNPYGQTYRLFGSNLDSFKCRDCGTIIRASTFLPAEYMWKEDNKEWNRVVKELQDAKSETYKEKVKKLKESKER